MKKEIMIFTDGASKSNPGPGGWGVVIMSGDKIVELGGREENTTNNRMELTSAIRALDYFVLNSKGGKFCTKLFSDSAYLINGVTNWIYKWEKNNWKTKTKKSVENRDLWEKLAGLASQLGEIDWNNISGHVGVIGNERADEIASDFASGKNPKLFSGDISSYSLDIDDISHDTEKKKNKDSTRSRSRAPAYSYISAINGDIAVHKTWAECEGRVKGVTGARFKKALSQSDEKKIIREFSS